jgi:hypothetical protein
MDKFTEADLVRFWSYVDKSGGTDACWLWMRSRNRQGYGQFYPSGGKRAYAHRWILGALRGKTLLREPVGVEDACHRCDNPPCVNPAHLYVGSRQRNVADAVERGRIWQLKVAACPRGHEYETPAGAGRRRCRMRERATTSCSPRSENSLQERPRVDCRQHRTVQERHPKVSNLRNRPHRSPQTAS